MHDDHRHMPDIENCHTWRLCCVQNKKMQMQKLTVRTMPFCMRTERF